ncbi:hypothetical protein CcrColossus_gp394 [Caulobacter phage CcrColossus]|uniref:Uncharacterized protein n=1 Tax=Caulobacter phage CcrColossus TaxID=1211640 RepID=K4JSD5_9CAUD|nr:hypothetical protein CcrColossus_gp394 [Caulobacter phage CcrColossus]AFU88264.1 hypothetical protein CcrColossus_gp394 [Caulobacter phage CcrColossus]
MTEFLITCPHCGGVVPPDAENNVDLAAVEALAMQLHTRTGAAPNWHQAEPDDRAYWRGVARRLLVEAAEEMTETDDDD